MPSYFGIKTNKTADIPTSGRKKKTEACGQTFKPDTAFIVENKQKQAFSMQSPAIKASL